MSEYPDLYVIKHSRHELIPHPAYLNEQQAYLYGVPEKYVHESKLKELEESLEVAIRIAVAELTQALHDKEEKLQIAREAIESAMRIKDLWILNNPTPEHDHEAVALRAMETRFEEALERIK